MKKAIFLLCVILPIFVTAQQGKVSPLNPAFVRFQQQYLSGKINFMSDDGHPLGYIPPPKMPVTEVYSPGPPPNSPLMPSVYDLRKLGLVTPVKNQGSCGSCWCFGTYDAIESHWLVLGLGDSSLSENNLKDCSGFSIGPCNGGDSWMSISYLSRKSGPVSNMNDPYNENPEPCDTGLPVMAYEMDARLLTKDINTIKQAVMNYGAIYTAFYYDDAYYNGSNYTYYYNGSTSPNHAVGIAGWNDTLVTAGGTGAWIIKNSWGTGWGQDGYFYISYNDSQVNSEVCYYPSKLTINDSSTVYLYDSLGEVYDFGFMSDVAYALVKFVTTNSYPITRIASWIASGNGTADIQIYGSFNGTTLSDLLETVPTQSLPYAGYYTFDLPSPLSLGSGTAFYVKIKYYTPGYISPIPIEAAESGYSDNAIIQSGVCWVSADSTHWSTIGKGTSNPYNLCISAYGANEPPAPITTAGSVAVCPGSSLTVPINVSGFNNITSLRLRIDYDPDSLTYISFSNVNSLLTGLTVHDSLLTSGMHALRISWTGAAATTLASNSKIVDLTFNYVSGNFILAFNNTDDFGWDCQYTDAKRGALYDNPTSTHYINARITQRTFPVPTITGPTTPCLSSQQTYSTETGMTNYVWNVSSGGSITGGQGSSTIQVVWSQPGAQTVNVTYTNLTGCTAINPTVLNVNAQTVPSAAESIIGTSSVCQGSQNIAYSVHPVSGAWTYIWSLPPGASIVTGENTANITVDYSIGAESGVMNVSGQDSCGNGTPSPDFPVKVNPVPATPVITRIDTCLQSSAASGNQWYNENGMIDGANQSDYCPPNDPHWYYDMVTLAGCSSDTSNNIYYNSNGIPNNPSGRLLIYPNPAGTSFTVGTNITLSTNSRMEFCDVFGNLLQVKDCNNQPGGAQKWIFDCQGIPNGIYFLKFINGSENMVRKIIINH
jgi:hypothetical protein